MPFSTTVRRRLRVAARVVVTLFSASVVVVSALAWVQVRDLDRSTTAASVIGDADSASSAPLAEQNILLLGIDSRTDPQGNPLPSNLLAALHAGDGSDGGDTADSITVVHVPAGGGRATAISIPRDSYVDLADGSGPHKINSAYARGVASATAALTGQSGSGGAVSSSFAPERAPTVSPDDPAVRRAALAAGAKNTIETVEAFTGLHITHFASVNLAGFADVSQALGGVPVCLRAPVDDPYSGLQLGAGPHEVTGAQALAFVRQRHGLPDGDLDRIARQQVFLAGATDKLLSAGTLANPFAVDRLTQAVSRSVTLDQDWDVLSFARQLHGLSAGAVTFRTIPTHEITMSTPDGDAVQVFPDEVRRFIAQAIATDAGVPAPVTAAPVTAPAASAPTVPTTPPAAPVTTAPVTPPITAAAPGCVS